MNKNSTKYLLLILLVCFLNIGKIIAQPAVYESQASGQWSDANIWKVWPSGTIGVGTPAGPPVDFVPTGTDKVVIHNGHTIEMNGSRACYGLIVEAGGKLWVNSPTLTRLQLGTGGGAFTYPVNDSLRNDGTIGGSADGIYFELGTNAANFKLSGTGITQIRQIRIPGNLSGAAANGGIVNLSIGCNIDLTGSNEVLTAVYNPALTNNYTISILAGSTVKTTAVDGFWHRNHLSGNYGSYTYNISGTLDLSSNTSTGDLRSATLTAPGTSASSKITVNIDGGTLKLGKEFRMDTTKDAIRLSAGVLDFNVVNGGVVDASATADLLIGKTTEGNGTGTMHNLFFGLDATGIVKQTVAGTKITFPIGIYTGDTRNDIALTNTGTPDIFSVGLKTTFDYPPADISSVVNRQWDISEAVAGGSVVTLEQNWLTNEQAVNFNPASINVKAMHLNGTTWEYFAGTVTGSGTIADPYKCTSTGLSSFSPYGVIDHNVPVPVMFVNVKAFEKDNDIQVEWANATELNVNNYVIERSADGRAFTQTNILLAKTNNGRLNNYAWLDEATLSGNNFYRIKVYENDGTSRYSSIVKVNIDKAITGFAIYPNPVKGSVVNLQLTNLAKGIYTANLYNGLGQQVYKAGINHNGGSATQQLVLPVSIKAGMYNLQLTNGINKFNQRLVVE